MREKTLRNLSSKSRPTLALMERIISSRGILQPREFVVQTPMVGILAGDGTHQARRWWMLTKPAIRERQQRFFSPASQTILPMVDMAVHFRLIHQVFQGPTGIKKLMLTLLFRHQAVTSMVQAGKISGCTGLRMFTLWRQRLRMK